MEKAALLARMVPFFYVWRKGDGGVNGEDLQNLAAMKGCVGWGAKAER